MNDLNIECAGFYEVDDAPTNMLVGILSEKGHRGEDEKAIKPEFNIFLKLFIEKFCLPSHYIISYMYCFFNFQCTHVYILQY